MGGKNRFRLRPVKGFICFVLCGSQETILLDKIENPFRRVVPTELNLRAETFFEADSFGAVILAAVRRAGNGVGTPSDAVFAFEKVSQFFCGVRFGEVFVDAAFAAFDAAPAGECRGDFILSDKPRTSGSSVISEVYSLRSRLSSGRDL